MTRILVHIHLYYFDMWSEIASRLQNITEPFDLFVTIPPENETLQTEILRFKQDADVRVVENCGFDIAPFINVLNRVDLYVYDYVIKLHTKRDMPVGTIRNGFDVSGGKWRRLGMRFLETRDTFTRVLRAFETDKTLGMTGDFRIICKEDRNKAAADAAAIIERLGLPTDRHMYVMGTMFIARAKLFEPLKRLNLTAADFVAGTEADGQQQRGADPLPYALECVFGYLTGAQGYAIKDPLHSKTYQIAARVCSVIGHFLYRKKIGYDGKTVIKICKIPVFAKRGRK
mgnify:CR=1 FL=1